VSRYLRVPRPFFVRVVVGDTAYDVLPGLPLAIDLPGDRFPATVTLHGFDGRALTEPFVGVIVKDTWGYRMLPLLDTLNRPPWTCLPHISEIHVFPEGHTQTVEQTCSSFDFAFARRDILRPAGEWPDHVIVEQTLVDALGRTKNTVDDVPVIFHTDPDALTVGRKLWLFGALPFLVAYLAGSILRRRRG
jgi:hypothetical protein